MPEKKFSEYGSHELNCILTGTCIVETAARATNQAAGAFLKAAIGIAVLVGTVLAIVLV